MYHIAHIAPNQEQSELLRNLAKALDLLGKSPNFHRVDRVPELRDALRKRDFSLVMISTQYSQKQLLERLSVVLDHCRAMHKIIPLVYDVEWTERLPHILGTQWGGHVGILHSFSSRNEILATLHRMGELLRDVESDSYRILGSLAKKDPS